METTIPSSAAFIWSEPTGLGRNVFCRFIRKFELETSYPEAVLNLFADSRYRLFANGALVGTGPGRFVPAHPECDSYDLAPHLQPGRNTLVVEVTSPGTSTFQTHRESRGGFIAWGKIGEGIDLATPGDWQCQALNAWDAEAPPFTFALGPSEILDTRKLDLAETTKPVPLENQGTWGSLEPRTVPYPSLEPIFPDRLLHVFNIADDEQIVGFRQYDPNFDAEASDRRWTLYSSWLHSPKEQTIDIGIFWGNHLLNGQPLECCNDARRGNRQNATLNLSKGWNSLIGEVEQLEEVWGLPIGIPREAGITIRAEADFDCNSSLKFSNLVPANPPRVSNHWNTVPIGQKPQLPARIRAWDLPTTQESTTRTWVYEFDEEFNGHIVVEVDAPAGAVLDVAVDDWLRDDGLVDLFNTNPFAGTVDRYILKGGSQRIVGFHVRGGHYLQLTLSAGNVEGVQVLCGNSEFPIAGNFECSDPILSKVWKTAARTLQVSTEECYADCPWRERGTYLGDGYVNLHMHRMLNCDARIPRRFLRLFAQSQFANGQMPPAAPSWMATPLEDYTLLWISCLRDHWVATQDTALVRELWPAVEKIIASPEWIEDPGGLWNADHLHLFIDWGVLPEEREGRGNAVLNTFRIQALEHAAELAKILQLDKREAELVTESFRVRLAFAEQLWIEEEGRFAAGLNQTSPALHANILALLFRIGSEKQQAQTRQYVKKLLAENLQMAKDDQPGHAEYYFLFYALEALYQTGETAFAEQLVRSHYGLMLKHNPGTLWECISRGIQSKGSRCHSWAGAPLVTAIRHTLGIRQPDPANPDRFIVAPNAETIDWAKGTYPHPKGDIRVEWKRIDGKIQIETNAPDGVSIERLKL